MVGKRRLVLVVVGIVCVAVVGVLCFASGLGATGTVAPAEGEVLQHSPLANAQDDGGEAGDDGNRPAALGGNERLDGKVEGGGILQHSPLANAQNDGGAGGGASTTSSGSGSGAGTGGGGAGPTVTLSVDCYTVLGHMDRLAAGKEGLVGNGAIMAARAVSFTDGETVFDVLSRECRAAGMHMESVTTPIYGSAYIEGINNIYEFDCGELSGWMYSVNGVFPNYGCSQYALKDGDVVAWRYTLDLGADIGGSGVVQG